MATEAELVVLALQDCPRCGRSATTHKRDEEMWYCWDDSYCWWTREHANRLHAKRCVGDDSYPPDADGKTHFDYVAPWDN